MNAKFITVLIIISICFIAGCGLSALSDDQILSKANEYAMSEGLDLQRYDVSLIPPGDTQGQLDFSKNVEAVAGHDARVVVLKPKNRRHDPAYTFYINKNTGKLTMITKHK
jgi:hypothetical protein